MHGNMVGVSVGTMEADGGDTTTKKQKAMCSGEGIKSVFLLPV